MNKKRLEGLSGGIFMIGLGLLFLVPGFGFWPWILVVIGAASLPASLAAKKGWAGWHSFAWMCGLAVLFATGLFWPGILILIGASALIEALAKGSDRGPISRDEETRREWTDDFGDIPGNENVAHDSFDFEASPSTRANHETDVLSLEPEVVDDSDHNTRRLEE